MTEHITLNTLRRLARLVNAVEQQARIRWIPDDADDPLEGALRRFVDGKGNLTRSDDNVLDASVWITTWSSEIVLSVRYVLDLMEQGRLDPGDR